MSGSDALSPLSSPTAVTPPGDRRWYCRSASDYNYYQRHVAGRSRPTGAISCGGGGQAAVLGPGPALEPSSLEGYGPVAAGSCLAGRSDPQAHHVGGQLLPLELESASLERGIQAGDRRGV